MKNFIFIWSCLLLVSFCEADIITVDDDGPADFDNIQAAIDDANSGDTVIVADGNYTGSGNRDLDFGGKAIIVRSENGPNNCIIDCENSGRGFYFHSNEGHDSVVDGFTIINGYSSYSGGGICMMVDWDTWVSSTPTIKNCIICYNNTDGTGGGIYFYATEHQKGPIITNCVISNNYKCGIFYYVDEIWPMPSAGVISNCKIKINKGIIS